MHNYALSYHSLKQVSLDVKLSKWKHPPQRCISSTGT